MQVGAAANLLLGLRPEWTAGDGWWLAPPRQPFVLYDIDVAARGAWQQPVLSVHDDVDDLLDAIFDVRVLPFQAQRTPFRIPASALMGRASLSERFGIELLPDLGYLLVKLCREDAELMHEGAHGRSGRSAPIKTHWTAEGWHAMARLRTVERIFDGAAREAIITARQARRYLDYCYDFGTHFVSRIVAGDVMVQVFACEPSRYRHIKKTLAREAGATSVSGPLARSFDFFTRPEWVTAGGRIFSASGDADLEKAGRILAIDPASLPVSRVAPVTVGLAPQSSLMETFRSGAFRRVVQGALLQKYGPRIQLPVGRTDMHVPEEFTFPSTARRSGDCLTAFSILLRDMSPIAEKHVAICSYRTSPRAIDGVLPALALSDEAFDTYELATGQMEGGLFVTNRDGSRRETLFEGLRFAGDARVKLGGDLQTPSRDVTPEAMRTIDYAETLLRRPSSTKEEAAFARDYLEWLASMVNADRARILYLARVAGPWARDSAAIDRNELRAIVDEVACVAIEIRHGVNVARLRDVAGRVDAMLQVAARPIVFGEEAEAARAGALRASEKAGNQAIIDMLSSKPGRLAGVLDGDAPICRFSQLVFQIGNALATTEAIEMLAAGSHERANSVLASLEAPVALPTQRDWEELADVAGDDEELRTALRSLSIAGPWLESRMRRAQHQLDRFAFDTGDDLIAAKWRLIKVLARLEHRLGVRPAATLDLSALAQSLAHAIV